MIRLFTSYYDEKHHWRKAELDACLLNNIQNRFIDQIIVLVEGQWESVIIDNSVPVKAMVTWVGVEVPIQDDKIITIKTQGRPTFSNFFDEINRFASEDDISIISNSDIYFDDTLELVKGMKPNECYALSRHEVNEDGSEGMFIQKNGDSSDVWVFKGKIQPMSYTDFGLGILGTDNRIAYEIKQAGYNITNPCLDIKAWHLHCSNIRNYDPLIDRQKGNVIPPPYHIVRPSHLPVPVKEEKIRLLYVGMNTIQNPPNGLTKAFQKHFDIKELNTSNTRLNESILFLASTWKPEIVFMQIQKANVVSVEALEGMKALGCFVINFTGDIRERQEIQWMYDMAKHISLTVFTNLTDVYGMRQYGFNSIQLELGIDPEIYTPIGEQKECKEIVFMGNNYGMTYFPLSTERISMVNYMKKRFGERFGVYGTGWGVGQSNIADGNFMASQNEEAARYRGSKIAINYSHFNYDSYSSDRLTRILGTGTFCLCKRFINCETRFQDGIHLRYFDTLDELGFWTDYYTDPVNEEERKRIAKAGCELVHEKYKFENLVTSIKEVYEESKKEKPKSKRRVLGYVPILYGAEYLKECIQSMHDHVEKIYVMYTPQPSQGHSTDLPCPETEKELRAIAETASDKVIWHSGVYSYEAQHRAEIYKFSGNFDQIFTLDADEIVDQEDIGRALDEAWATGKRNIGIDGFINFWKSFDYACYDSFRPIRIINLNVQDNSMAEVKCRIYHFSYAQSRRITDFKWSVSGHALEVRKGWLNDIYYAWRKDNQFDNLHPVALNLWNATPFDKTTLPKALQQHENFSKEVIE